jgi:hypothetical protein
MAFNAEKQARYRERHLENGTKTRGHFFLEATTKAKLLRLAHHRNCRSATWPQAPSAS